MCCIDRRGIYIFAIVMCFVFNMYIGHLMLCVVCFNGRRYVCCSECYVVFNEYDESTHLFVRPIGARGGKVMYFGSFRFRGNLSFLNCHDICMCVVNKQFKLIELVFNSVYVDL